jgi:hypothetical protein
VILCCVSLQRTKLTALTLSSEALFIVLAEKQGRSFRPRPSPLPPPSHPSHHPPLLPSLKPPARRNSPPPTRHCLSCSCGPQGLPSPLRLSWPGWRSRGTCGRSTPRGRGFSRLHWASCWGGPAWVDLVSDCRIGRRLSEVMDGGRGEDMRNDLRRGIHG